MKYFFLMHTFWGAWKFYKQQLLHPLLNPYAGTNKLRS